MPFEYEIKADDRVIISRLSGDLTPQLLVALRQTVSSDPGFSTAYNAIDDVRGVETVSITNEHLTQMASVSVLSPGTRHAIVVANDLQFGLARMYASYADMAEFEIRVFRDFDEAWKWVAVES